MPQVQEVWNKLNSREKLTAWGALAVALGWIIGLAGSFGLGGNTIALLGAIAVLVILFLKYSPNQSITWPAPIPLINLAISAVVALLALLGLLQWLQLLGGFGSVFGAALIAAIVTAVGAGLMAWGSWQEYQLTKPATPASASSSTPPPPPAPPAAPPPPSASDTDDLPPA
ncbi:MAG TPA: hypothetical protein VK233_02755 [Candidatus Dormibacteraeota bacterium]|nr:hypothetical protein [Candidatus Dormibacteraeota bacterium]